MTDRRFIAAALALGLAAVRHDFRAGRVPKAGRPCKATCFWMVTWRGRELGSFVPATGSVRCVGKVSKVKTARAALAVYAEFVREQQGRAR